MAYMLTVISYLDQSDFLYSKLNYRQLYNWISRKVWNKYNQIIIKKKLPAHVALPQPPHLVLKHIIIDVICDAVRLTLNGILYTLLAVLNRIYHKLVRRTERTYTNTRLCAHCSR